MLSRANLRAQMQRNAGGRNRSSSSSSSLSTTAQVVRRSSCCCSRRQLLQSVLLLATSLQPGSAKADASQDLEQLLPGQPAAVELPKPYQRTMHKLVRALQTSIEAEAAGAKEFEVRRKADPAKELVKEFVGKWQDNAAVAGDVTHDEMKVALSELGRFYQRSGPRSRLDEDTKAAVLAHLAAVQAALPAEEKSLLGF